LFPGWSWFTLYGKPDSKVAKSGKRLLQYRLFELPKPEPFSVDFTLKNVSFDGIDLVAPPGSGAVFRVRNHCQPVHVVFLPSFNSTTGSGLDSGATFVVQANNNSIYRHHVAAAEHLDPVIHLIPNAQTQDSISIAFVTKSGRTSGLGEGESVWKNVKIVVGDAYVDTNRIKDKQLRAAWVKWNPTGKQ
jgi:hypothetical protein